MMKTYEHSLQDAAKYPYKDFKVYDTTPISVEIWNDSKPVEMHCQKYYEFAIIVKGSCKHTYNGVQIPLIPGDVFLVAPNRPHAYDLQAPVSIINCLFYPEELSDENNQMLKNITSRHPSVPSGSELTRQWDELLQFVTFNEETSGDLRQTNLNKQGIIHLDPLEFDAVLNLLHSMHREQTQQEINSVYAKSAYLQLILVTLSRVRNQRMQRMKGRSNQKRDMI